MGYKVKRYGWKPDLPDHRDAPFRKAMAPIQLPSRIDLRNFCPPPYDQGDVGSCTANAIAGALEFDLIKDGRGGFTPSRLFIYYNEREMEDTVDFDSGAMIRDGCKSVGKIGVCPEIQWPYIEDNFLLRPEQICYDEARLDLASNYFRLNQDAQSLKSCLAQGYPFVFGFTVYSGFESDAVAQTGIVYLPEPHETVQGGHAVLCVGYDDATSRFLVRNSWGIGWGIGGYFTMPYEYVCNPDLSNDFWVLKRYV